MNGNRKMKMKLLDATLLGILASMASAAAMAQDAVATEAATAAPTDTAIDCDDSGCRTGNATLFQLRTRSFDQPVTTGTSARSSSAALQPDRRVSVALEQPGRATALGRFSVQLPGGGAIWATEDPDLGQLELSVSGPSLAPFEAGRITRPVRFYARSNYVDFIDRLELTLYRASDADLIEPIAQLDLPHAAVADAEWDGTLPAGRQFRPGDELVYVLRAYDAQGHFDETYTHRLQLVTPAEADRGDQMLRTGTERALGTALTADQAATQSLVDAVFAGNGLRQQNIPVYGSRVRIQGRNLAEGQTLLINGDSYPVDLERKFVAEYLMPVGQHRFDIGLKNRNGDTAHHALDVDVSGRYLFGVGIADVTVFQNKASGPGREIALAGREDDILSDGRLAFYGKGKIGGKYLITAQADTQNRPLGDLFDGFTAADPQDIFRRVDPDLYYPSYGDDSTTYRDVDTMGRFYVRMDWDKNQALWGNFSTGFTGTEYGQYQRALYGAALAWRSRAANVWGDPVSELRAFGSEAQTAPGHSEFVGTGGSLYYLRHTDVLPGSEQVVVETRDPTTGRVEVRSVLLRGADYEIDELQGRILLTRPLMPVSRDNVPTITRDAPLDGFEQRLIVDYEWVPAGFDPDEIAAGVRAKQWFGDHVGLGATWVDENRAGEDYTLMSADLTLQAGKGTYLKLEHSRTESTGAPVFFSDNGGFTFTQLNPVGPREGEASAVELRANFRELGWTTQDWSSGAWWRRVDAGFSVARFDTGADIEEYGAEVLGEFTSDIGFYARYSRAERGVDALTQAQVTTEWRFSDVASLAAEIRRVQEERAAFADVAGTLGALRYTHRFGTSLDLYGTAQLTLDDDEGRYADNDAFTLGGRYNFANLSTLGGEVTTGDRGDAAQVNGEYRLSPQHALYGAYTYSTDTTEYDPLFNPTRQNGWTLGQRWRLSNQVNIFNESQFLKTRQESGLAHTYGMDFYPGVGWNLGFTLSDGELTTRDGGQVDRRAISVSGGRTSNVTDWQSKVEWREDTGAERRTQWITTNRVQHRLNESWRVAARFNYADTQDDLDPRASAKFIESNLGFAYRPWDGSRWGLFGRYTYLYDLATLGQLGGADYDQKSQVLSLEGVYRIDDRWEVAGKLARREGEARYGRGTGAWFDSATTFAASQVRYELLHKWHALAEYRWLDVDDGGTRQGWMAGVDRDIGRNFRVGVGYNFTDFSDDLTDLDYDHRGFYINFVGSY